MSFETPQAVANELKLFTENDGDLYRQQTTSILKNLATKKAKGIYDHVKAIQAWMYLAEAGARAYVKQHGSPTDTWHTMFPVNVRRECAVAWRDEFETEYDLGNYERLLPKKYQKGDK